MHREENVDVDERLRSLVAALEQLHAEFGLPIICSTHPRTRIRIERSGLKLPDASRIRFLEPFGFFDFIALEKNAFCVLSDSGTVQEECSIFGVANVTLRDVTERPETLECGSNMLSGADPADIMRCVKTVLANSERWTAPAEYLVTSVSGPVTKILLGYDYAGTPR